MTTPNASINSETIQHLSYPPPDPTPDLSSNPPTQQPRQLLKDRLYIGNLHPTVDEYTLLQIFNKFGRVTKLDFLFHKTGLMKGKPRGYAFVEYGNKDDALKALNTAHDKLLRGRKLVVTFAHQAPLDQGVGLGLGGKHRKGMMETGRPTTLSLLKTIGGRSDATHDRIAMIEAKLRQIESTKPKAPPLSSASTLGASSSSPDPPALPSSKTQIASSGTTHPLSHPSLPLKPPPPIPSHLHSLPSRLSPASNSNANSTSNQVQGQGQIPHANVRQNHPLPALPIVPQPIRQQGIAMPSGGGGSLGQSRLTSSTGTGGVKAVRLVGVKIRKEKEKEREKGT